MNDEVYCTNEKCPLTDCWRNPKGKTLPKQAGFAHLEENPLYCKKSNWNRNQYKEDR